MLDGDCYAGDKATATYRHYNRVKVFDIVKNLQADGALTSENVNVIVAVQLKVLKLHQKMEASAPIDVRHALLFDHAQRRHT